MKRSESFNIILLGDPASGKATQAARLIKKYHLYDFDMGREVRKPATRARFDYGKTTGAGKLTPTAVVRNILKRVIPSVPLKKGILFNGHPKMIGEAKLVSRLLAKAKRNDTLVLYIHIPMKETIRRAAERSRDDDSLRALKNRWKYYEEQISQVRAFFKKKYSMVQIKGTGTEAAVWNRIRKAIEQVRKS